MLLEIKKSLLGEMEKVTWQNCKKKVTVLEALYCVGGIA